MSGLSSGALLEGRTTSPRVSAPFARPRGYWCRKPIIHSDHKNCLRTRHQVRRPVCGQHRFHGFQDGERRRNCLTRRTIVRSNRNGRPVSDLFYWRGPRRGDTGRPVNRSFSADLSALADGSGGQVLRFTKRNACQAESGFTLIEALVTLAVVAVSLAAIGSLVAVSNRGTAAVHQRLSLLETANYLLTALDRRQLAVGDGRGEVGGNRWQVEVHPFAADFVAPHGGSPWLPEVVVIRVQSPNGQSLRLEVVRLRARTT